LDVSIRQLHVALEVPAFVQVLKGLVPTQDSENQLDLLVAILDYQQVKAANRGALGDEIRARFLLETSLHRVFVPTVVLQRPQDEMMDLLDYCMLKELVKLPEVRAALELKQAQLPDLPKRSSKLDRRLSSKSIILTYHEDMWAIGKLEAVIHNRDTRKMLLHALLSSSGNLMVKIRFISAVDDMLSKEEGRAQMTEQILKIFAAGGMFGIPSIALDIENGRLSQARESLLRELSENNDVIKALTTFADQAIQKVPQEDIVLI
jgi:hypothetical protein